MMNDNIINEISRVQQLLLRNEHVRDYARNNDHWYLTGNEKMWGFISRIPNLSNDFIIEFADRLNCDLLWCYNNLPEDIVRKFQHRFSQSSWCYISFYRILSENFIREFQEKVNWINIGRGQRLSENFIKEFESKLVPISVFYPDGKCCIFPLSKICSQFEKLRLNLLIYLEKEQYSIAEISEDSKEIYLEKREN